MRGKGCEKRGGVMTWDVVCCDELWKESVIFAQVRWNISVGFL